MENKGADLPKEPPKYPAFETTFGKEKKLRCSWLFWLLFYSGAVTAALIVLSIVGSIYVNRIEEYCEKTDTGTNTSVGQWKDYTKALYGSEVESAASEESDSVYLNVEANKQMTKDSNGSITVTDFNKGVTGYYDKPTDKCYLIGGVDPNLASPKEIDQYLSSQDADPKPASDKPETVEYVTGEEVKDTSWLPTDLQGVCAGKQTNWLNVNKTTDATNDGVGASYHCHYYVRYRCYFYLRCWFFFCRWTLRCYYYRYYTCH